MGLSGTVILSALALVAVTLTVRHGTRQQVWEPNAPKARREAERIVYGGGVWINVTADGRPETPDEGIARIEKELRRER